ncbi:protein FAM240B-like isoform X1 [Eublepharis macularius]|uniref:Protein FAM240B-like isoform X1 n=2 Tax=Eublepharis macularius TaxID=481883 RepID=A0AA97JTD3_EUBMA|nr:protein FAM240B-like isoform X1 [Eublepharis macularius]
MLVRYRNHLKEKMNSQYFRHEVLACETGGLKNFWEKTIEKQTQHLEVERERKQKSALTKLRNEWMERLEKRLKMIKANDESEEAPN